jgi:hypothetical protein
MCIEIVMSYWGDRPPCIGAQNAIAIHCDISKKQTELDRK